MLLSSGDIFRLTGVFNQHFLTFMKPITVYRQKTLTPTTETNIYGYNNHENNLAYTQDVFIVSGIRHFPKRQPYNNQELKTSSLNNTTYIKVRQDAANLIQELPVEKIQVENISYNLAANPATIQDYLGLKFYIFELERIN
jgi:hypothetical protein